MHTVINISQPAKRWVQAEFLGKIVKLEAYASKQVANIPIILKKRATYKKEIVEYVDTLPAAGSTKTVNKAYRLPNDGVILYANGKNQQDIVNAYRNGYWDLSWEFISKLSGAPEDCRRWTLTNFKYVDGVKTTVATYTFDDVGTPNPEGGIWQPVVYSDYPTPLVLTASNGDSITLTFIDDEITVPDTYCTGSVETVVGWSEDVQPQDITLATLSVSKDSSASIAPKDSEDLPYFLGAGDEILVDASQSIANAMCVLIYIEN